MRKTFSWWKKHFTVLLFVNLIWDQSLLMGQQHYKLHIQPSCTSELDEQRLLVLIVALVKYNNQHLVNHHYQRIFLLFLKTDIKDKINSYCDVWSDVLILMQLIMYVVKLIFPRTILYLYFHVQPQLMAQHLSDERHYMYDCYRHCCIAHSHIFSFS
jgi:hypothetical protein